ncbi:Nramp family divalent metal transporter [Ectobacillus sp. sgz5001026]|uniref:Nramp family divalent metal transporter n=1 Tax=Ectobacillus sp. sgz5001026 TaxID=3242473 RepID=UPI0036D32659
MNRVKNNAVLDDAHVGDIHGAFGSISQHDKEARTSFGSRMKTLLAVMGPGLIVMVGDNDAGGVATYAEAGQNYGTSLLWVLLLLIPVLIVCQEMVVRLGLVTGVGHAQLIFNRFGKFWGWFSVGDLFLVNFLTIVTEFIGISLAMAHFGISPVISVPVAGVLLVMFTISGSFRSWERFMYLFIITNFIAIPLAFMAHPTITPIMTGFFLPHIQGGLNGDVMLLMIGIVGTTVAPWQLFFQQSNVIDKRLTPRWMKYERTDTIIGAFVVVIGAAALIITTAFAFQGTSFAGSFTNSGAVATGLAHTLGPVAGNIFAIVLLNASIIGAAALTLSTSYAVGDVFMVKHSLHRSWKDAKVFYSMYVFIIAAAAGIVLIPNAPLGLITILVQALAGVLLPSATVFLVILCNDKHVLGPWVNKRWQNVASIIIVGALVMLSLILATTTIFPNVDVPMLVEVLAAILVGSLLAAGVWMWKQDRNHPKIKVVIDEEEKLEWRMAPLEDLPPVKASMARTVAMVILRAYLIIAVGMLVVKAFQLALA